MDRLTVEVSFPEEVRRVPAHYHKPSQIEGGPFQFPRVVPDSMPGWRFIDTVGGVWLAVEEGSE